MKSLALLALASLLVAYGLSGGPAQKPPASTPTPAPAAVRAAPKPVDLLPLVQPAQPPAPWVPPPWTPIQDADWPTRIDY